MPKQPQARYLGDGVYVTMASGLIRVYTHDGISATNSVYLEPEVMHQLMLWVAEHTVIALPKRPKAPKEAP